MATLITPTAGTSHPRGVGQRYAGLTSWIQRELHSDSSGNQGLCRQTVVDTWPKVYSYGKNGRRDQDTLRCDENHLISLKSCLLGPPNRPG